jgi:ABC-type sugar transport system ATPase subunit
MGDDHICKITGVTKTFTGVHALKNVDLDILRGEIHGVIGENGAGKSTLMNILSGVFHPDSGTIEFDGHVVRLKDTRHAQGIGIAMIHQELSLARSMTVAENIFQGRMLKNALGLIDRKRMVRECREHLRSLGVEDIDPRTLVKFLSVSQMQLIEIAKAVSLNAKLLIMDEPTSSLTSGEISVLLSIMRSLREKKVSIVFITHKLEEILEVTDRITVLRDGSLIDTLDNKDTDIDQLVSMMVGRNFERKAHRQFITDYSGRKVVLEVEGINVGNRVKNASFRLFEGEVLGLTGLVGAGRTELLQGILGMDPVSSGKIRVNGKEVRIRHPAAAIKLGIGMVPENRKEEGMFLKLSVLDNMVMVHLKALSNGLQMINRKRTFKIAEKYVGDLSIKTPSLSQIAQNLSGGNQQKTVIARWLMHGPKILFLDEPTHGIDIGAKAEIYRLIDEMSKQGVAVVLLSSELPEVLNLCDRIMVMHHGEIKGILPHQEADQVKIMNLTLEEKAKTA